jgi:5-aminolevulinate synthase
MMSSQSHIIPVPVGDPDLCREASALLMEKFALYLQPINYPTVPRGTERLRITPTPFHNDQLIEDLANALCEVWDTLGLRREAINRAPMLRPHSFITGASQYSHSNAGANPL